MRRSILLLIRQLEGKRLLAIPRDRWKDTTKMDLKDVEYQVLDWIHLAHDKDQ
jgi:hypothetical protein